MVSMKSSRILFKGGHMKLRLLLIVACDIILIVSMIGCTAKVNPNSSTSVLDPEKKYMCYMCEVNYRCHTVGADQCNYQYFYGNNDSIANQCCPESIKEVK